VDENKKVEAVKGIISSLFASQRADPHRKKCLDTATLLR
jgi:hypothetical protein